MENIINAVIDLSRAQRDGQKVSTERFLKAVIGQGRIRPLPEAEIDERLTKLDDVQSYLTDAIDAIEDLKVTADESKATQRRLLTELSLLRENQQQAECEAKAISEATKTDIEAFQKLAGVPTKDEIWRGKVFGFVSGVLASVVAAGIVWGITELVKLA